MDFVSNDPNVAGTAWLSAIQLTGAGQGYVGQWTGDYSNDQVKSATSTKTPEGGVPASGFSIDFAMDKQKCYYIVNEPQKETMMEVDVRPVPITSWSYLGTLPNSHTGDCQGISSDRVNSYSIECGKAGGIYYSSASDVCCYTITQVPAAQAAPEYKTGTEFNAAMSIKNKQTGAIETLFINSGLNQSARSADGNVYASWSGSLLKDTCLSSSNWQYYKATTSATWGIGVKSGAGSYNDFKTKYIQTQYALNALTTNSQTIKTLRDYASISNGALTSFFNNPVKIASSLSGIQYTISSYTKLAPYPGIYYSSDTVINVPNIILSVKASWLGIYVPVTKPSITNIQPSQARITTGVPQTWFVTIKNTGDAQGSITTNINCPTPFGSNLGQPIGFATGEEKTIQLATSVATTSDVSAACTIQACDAATGKNCDSKSVAVVGVAAPTPTPICVGATCGPTPVPTAIITPTATPGPTATPTPSAEPKCPLLQKYNSSTGKCALDMVALIAVILVLMVVVGGAIIGYPYAKAQGWL